MNRMLAGIALVLMAQSAGAQEPMKYLAMGDSITRGNSWPAVKNPVVIFDGAGASDCTDQTNVDNCGYTGRLENRLNNAGFNVDVRNKGKGGEKTMGALSRIETELDAEAWDVMILMEGTNDVFRNISVSTIEFNLGAMVDQATARGVDTLLASVIRRINDPSHTKTKNLKDAIKSLATSKGRPFANPWLTLCATTSCFDTKYYQPDVTLGHLDKDGYSVITELFKDLILAQPIPAAPTPQAPSGDVLSQPAYEWAEVAEATWYELQVETDAANLLHDAWHETAVACSTAPCSVDPGLALPDGAYRWRARGRSLLGRSGWMAWQDFALYTAPPGAPAPLSPTGSLFDTQPTYTWSEVSVATSYLLDVSGPVAFSEPVDAITCASGACSRKSATVLTPGDYTFRLQASNPVGDGLFSTNMAFTVLDCSPLTLTLTASDIGSAPNFSACQTITLEGSYRVQTGESIFLHAGDSVIVESGFQVDAGGGLTVKVDP